MRVEGIKIKKEKIIPKKKININVNTEKIFSGISSVASRFAERGERIQIKEIPRYEGGKVSIVNYGDSFFNKSPPKANRKLPNIL